MADDEGATVVAEKPKRGRGKAAGDNPGEAGDNASAGAGDNPGETTGGLSADGQGPAGEPTPQVEELDETPVMARLAATGEEVTIDARSLVFDLRDGVLEFLKRLPQPWERTPFDQQRDIAAAAEQLSKDLVRRAVETIAADERTAIRALLVKYDEGDDIKVTLKVKAFSTEESEAAVLGLHRARGKHVLITVASADDYAEDQHDPAAVQPDQPGLGFEAGSDEHPEDDSDLAGGDDADKPFVNLKTGMVETPDGEGGVTEREATPEELAAERDRIADFGTA